MVETGTTSSSFVTVGVYIDRIATLTNLQPTTTYYIRVRAKAEENSEYADGNPSIGNGTTMALVKLQPPINMTLVGMTPTTLKYTYDPPAQTSGLTGYSFYLNNVLYQNRSVSQTREIVFTNLTPDTQYNLGFQSMGDQIYASDSDITTIYGTPLSDKLVITSERFPSSDTSLWDPTTGYTYQISPKTGLTTPADVFTTVFTG